jgi:hypothetical protein
MCLGLLLAKFFVQVSAGSVLGTIGTRVGVRYVDRWRFGPYVYLAFVVKVVGDYSLLIPLVTIGNRST